MPAELVARRGDSIKITLTLDRPYDKQNDDMQIFFSLGIFCCFCLTFDLNNDGLAD